MSDKVDNITAGELRAFGIPIPKVIPDNGSIPKSSITFYLSKKPEISEGGGLIIPMEFVTYSPFKWD